jgi:hypothetical protein
MVSPLSFDHLVVAHHAELMRQADAERLASQVTCSGLNLRSRLAAALYGLASRLDPCAVPSGSPASRQPA